jgi:hypothetical protein
MNAAILAEVIFLSSAFAGSANPRRNASNFRDGVARPGLNFQRAPALWNAMKRLQIAAK